MWPSLMDLSSSISQFGTPGTSGAGSWICASPSTCKPAARASSLTFSIIFCLVAPLILGMSTIRCNLSAKACCARWSSPPACSQNHGSRDTEPAASELAALETNANQNFRRSAMDSLRNVPSISVHPSSLKSLSKSILPSRTLPAAPAKRFHTRCIGSRSMSTKASPSWSHICSANATAAFMATMTAPGSVDLLTMRAQCSQLPRFSSSQRRASASSRFVQTQTQIASSLFALGPAWAPSRSGHRNCRSLTGSVPWKSIVWPRPMGTGKSTPSTPVNRGRYWFVLSCMFLYSAKVIL
mmetsp:Transcript_65708/g.152655  ORF Transcript_65708/g.152655 Transcript_65708/m.152655 type:complete len:297 (+) Transcript_65708:778-1668(+)